MRKKSKKRIAQDIVPWVRLNFRNHDDLNIYRNKVTRGFAGNKRDLQTKILNAQNSINSAKFLLKSLIFDQTLVNDFNEYRAQFFF